MMKKGIGILSTAVLLGLLCGCGGPQAAPSQEVAQTLPPTLLSSTELEPFQNISDVMDAGGWFCKNPDKRFSIYLYDSAQEAEEKFCCISSDCSTIQSGEHTYTVQWKQSPHFYLDKNKIVAYYGEEPQVLCQLEECFPA